MIFQSFFENNFGNEFNLFILETINIFEKFNFKSSKIMKLKATMINKTNRKGNFF